MYEVEKTPNFRFEYNKLNLRYKRWVDEAVDVIKETPTECQGKITRIGSRKNGSLYRFRIPGCYIIYVLPEHDDGEGATIQMTTIKMLR